MVSISCEAELRSQEEPIHDSCVHEGTTNQSHFRSDFSSQSINPLIFILKRQRERERVVTCCKSPTWNWLKQIKKLKFPVKKKAIFLCRGRKKRRETIFQFISSQVYFICIGCTHIHSLYSTQSCLKRWSPHNAVTHTGISQVLPTFNMCEYRL